MHTFQCGETYTNSHGTKVSSGPTIIHDNEVYFHIEKIPSSFNFFDLFRFKKLIKNSIIGNILKTYSLRDYFICLYTKSYCENKKTYTLLLEKINLLKNIVKQRIISEVWVIKDTQYSCIGIFEDTPVFLKSFKNIHDINENFDIMLENMNTYSEVKSIRFFGCDAKDFVSLEQNVSEYSESFMLNAMSGERSINRYCEQNYKIGYKFTSVLKYSILFNVALNIFSFGLYILSKQIETDTLTIKTKLLGMHSEDLPSIKHYYAIKNA